MAFQFAQADADFKIFDHIDEVLITQESREEWVTREPRVWPSAASAELYDQTIHKIVGKCQRALYFGFTATESSRQVDAKAGWKFVTGRLLEDALTKLAATTLPGMKKILIASGVRILVPDILLSFELDLVVLNPANNRAVLVENKTFSSKNYTKQKEILKEGKPSQDNLMQVCLYLFEIRTGKRLRQLILAGMADRAEKDKKQADLASHGIPFTHRNRIEVELENLALMDDGPLTAKLSYLDRSDGDRREIDVTIEEDIDGLHYPVVDGQVWKHFPMESIYARFKKLQEYYYTARAAAELNLAAKGITPPEEPDDIFSTKEEKDEFRVQDKIYWDMLGEAMRMLPMKFLPPAEYEFEYSAEKIELMWVRGMLAKTKYEGWKKKHKGKEHIGDWQCSWCDFKLNCMKIENPSMVYMIQDVNDAIAEECAS